MTQSATGIVNEALVLIGGDQIASLDDGSPNANRAIRIYDTNRDLLLRSSEWDFATSRRKLARLVAPPGYGFQYAHAMPTDWIRTIAVHHNEAGVGNFNYRNEQVNNQNVIVTDSYEVWLTYVRREVDPNKWPADFQKTLIELMARDLAVPVANSTTLSQIYDGRISRTSANARHTDSAGSFPEQRPRGSWANSRGGRRR